MAISYQSDDVASPKIKKRILNRWIRDTAKSHKKKVGDICYIFCSDNRILEINNEYLQHNYYTDIITFDYTIDDVIAGDIFISIDTVKSNSEEYNTSYEEELHRVIIHGILHLCGINDKEPHEQEMMTIAENCALELLTSINQ